MFSYILLETDEHTQETYVDQHNCTDILLYIFLENMCRHVYVHTRMHKRKAQCLSIDQLKMQLVSP